MWRKLFWKALWNGIVTVPLLLWFSATTTWFEAVVTSLALTVFAYIVGDQMILRSSNNTIASISDALLAFFFIWLVAYYAGWTLSFSELSVVSIALGVVEIFFHRYLGVDDGQRRYA